MTPTSRTAKWILTGLFVLALAATPFLARGDQQQQNITSRNAAVIARMSVSQRERLDQNFADYQKLNQADRDRLQQFHQQIEQDRQQGGELAATLKIYDDWLKTLNPHQRDRLIKTAPPKERLALIREIIGRQREETARRGLPMMSPEGDRRFEIPPTMDEKTRTAVMQAIEQQAANRLTSEQMQEVQSLQGIRRELRLLQLLKEFGTGVNPQPLLENPPIEFAAVAKEIDQHLEDPRLRDFIQNGPLPPLPEEQRPGSADARRLAFLVMQSMSVELIKLQQAAQHNVAHQKLSDFLAGLPMDEQMELLSLDASDFQTDLKKQYFDSTGMADLPRLNQINELFVGRSFWRRRFGDERFGGGAGRPPRRPDGPMNDGFNRGRPPGPPPRPPFDENEPRPPLPPSESPPNTPPQ